LISPDAKIELVIAVVFLLELELGSKEAWEF